LESRPGRRRAAGLPKPLPICRRFRDRPSRAGSLNRAGCGPRALPLVFASHSRRVTKGGYPALAVQTTVLWRAGRLRPPLVRNLGHNTSPPTFRLGRWPVRAVAVAAKREGLAFPITMARAFARMTGPSSTTSDRVASGAARPRAAAGSSRFSRSPRQP
jgi:hypothetical protein